MAPCERSALDAARPLTDIPPKHDTVQQNMLPHR